MNLGRNLITKFRFRFDCIFFEFSSLVIILKIFEWTCPHIPKLFISYSKQFLHIRYNFNSFFATHTYNNYRLFNQQNCKLSHPILKMVFISKHQKYHFNCLFDSVLYIRFNLIETIKTITIKTATMVKWKTHHNNNNDNPQDNNHSRDFDLYRLLVIGYNRLVYEFIDCCYPKWIHNSRKS